MAAVGQLSGYGDISLLVHLGETGQVSGSGGVLTLSGGLTGSGSVSDVVLGGSVDIGNSPGTLELEDVVVDSTAIFGMEIGGTTLADYDRILLAGGVMLDGVMNVSFINGFEPADSDVFELIDMGSASVTGWFSSINAPTDWSLSASGQLYNTTVIPEPAALLLALLGLALLPRRRRRQVLGETIDSQNAATMPPIYCFPRRFFTSFESPRGCSAFKKATECRRWYKIQTALFEGTLCHLNSLKGPRFPLDWTPVSNSRTVFTWVS